MREHIILPTGPHLITTLTRHIRHRTLSELSTVVYQAAPRDKNSLPSTLIHLQHIPIWRPVDELCSLYGKISFRMITISALKSLFQIIYIQENRFITTLTTIQPFVKHCQSAEAKKLYGIAFTHSPSFERPLFSPIPLSDGLLLRHCDVQQSLTD